MSSLAIVTDQPLQTARGATFADTDWSFELAATFRPAFTQLTLVGTRADQLFAPLPVASEFRVAIVDRNLVRRFAHVAAIVRRHDAVFVKLFSLNGLVATIIALVLRKPAASILVGDSALSLEERSDVLPSRVLRRCAATAVRLLLIGCQNLVQSPGFVSSALRRRYPSLRSRAWVANESWTHAASIASATHERSPVAGRVLFVGRLVWAKGLRELLVAIRELVDNGRDISLHVVGDGRDREAFEREVAKHGLNDHVSVTGWMAAGSREMQSEFAAAEVFCLPSYSEGTPLVLIEAASRGVPIVATDVGGVRDLAGGAAVLVEARDPVALAGGLARALDAPREEFRSSLHAMASRNSFERQRGAIGLAVQELVPNVDS